VIDEMMAIAGPDHVSRQMFRLLLIERNLIALVAIEPPIINYRIALLGGLAGALALVQQLDTALQAHKTS
jgi:hypothetical protein